MVSERTCSGTFCSCSCAEASDSEAISCETEEENSNLTDETTSPTATNLLALLDETFGESDLTAFDDEESDQEIVDLVKIYN